MTTLTRRRPDPGRHGRTRRRRWPLRRPWLRGRLAARLRRDDGVAAVWILLTVPVVAIAVGFVLDTSTAVYGWNSAHDQAASAARAGAQQINLDLYRRTGTIQLDPPAATAAAQAFLSTLGATGTVTATITTVTVTVTRTTANQMLSLVGVSSFTEHATVTARPLHGVAGPAP
jgi:Flp pilus assembly protein TadG